jgi:predicted ribosome quality control (RQC) complex YloA/Tae2 family protein
MEQAIQKELQQIKGVGAVLAQRLVEAGLDSFSRVAEAGEEGLKKIRGINPRTIPSILEQARGLAGEVAASHDEKLRALQETAERLEKQVQDLAAALRERQAEKLSGKKAERLEKELSKLLQGLDRVKRQQRPRIKRARKGIAKAGQRLAGLTEDGIKGLTRGFKKARKSLKRALA